MAIIPPRLVRLLRQVAAKTVNTNGVIRFRTGACPIGTYPIGS